MNYKGKIRQVIDISRKYKWVIILIFEALFILTALMRSIDPLVLLSIVIFLNCIIYTLIKLENRVILFAFLCCFFVFLMGSQFVEEFFSLEKTIVFSEQINRHINISIIISLLCIMVGFIMGSYLHTNTIIQKYIKDKFSFIERYVSFLKPKRKLQDKIIDTDIYSSDYYLSVRFVSKIIFYVTYVPCILILMERISFVQNFGYYESYISYISNIPYIFTKIGEVAPIVFYIFLATMPSYKECKLPILFYLLYACLTLLTGRRLFFMATLIIIFIYYIIRNSINPGDRKWFGKREIIVAVVLLPIIIVGMYFYHYMRANNAVASSSPFYYILAFLQQQGFSVNVIGYERLFASQLPDKHIYSFYDTLRFYRASMLTKWFVNQDYGFIYGTYTEATAIHSNSLAHALSRIVMPVSYFKGYGLGSSYVAELYHDFGSLGLALGNVLYGLFIYFISKFKNRSLWIIAMVFNILEYLFKAPRYNFDVFFIKVIDPTMWLVFLVVYILSKFWRQKIRGRI